MMCLILGSGIRAMRFCFETALIPELYLQSGWNGMRRKEAEVGGRKGGRGGALISLDFYDKREGYFSIIS